MVAPFSRGSRNQVKYEYPAFKVPITDWQVQLFTILDDVVYKDLPVGVDTQEGRVPNDYQQSLRSSQGHVESEKK